MALRNEYRVVLLLACSYAFYAFASVWHLAVLLAVTVISFVFGIALEARRDRVLLGLAVLCTLSLLGLFKYIGFVASLAATAGVVGRSWLTGLSLLLPVGISFYTFQAVSYLVDVYRGSTAATRSLPVFALYLSFFPQVLAGPIERSHRLTPQLAALSRPHVEDVYLGLKTALWGLFCKVVVADKLAMVVDNLLGSYGSQSGLALLIGLFLYSFQIYFDFYGYSTMAIGLARTFGVHLSLNFRNPYLATSLRDFWRRWHITLMTWFRDYVYIPLGGGTSGKWRFVLAISVVFIASGLWHGAGIAFVLWGVAHGALFLANRATTRFTKRVGDWMRHASLEWLWWVCCVLTTFTLVSVAWLPFAVPDLGSSAAILRRIVGLDGGDPWMVVGAELLRADVLVFVGVAVLFFVLDSAGVLEAVTSKVPKSVAGVVGELAMVNTLTVLIVTIGGLGTRAFIYFRF